MRFMIRGFMVGLICLAVTFHPATSHAQELDPSFRADIVKLMEVTGAAKIGEQMAKIISTQMLDVFRKRFPEASPRAIDIVQEALNSEFAAAFGAPDGLAARLVPIYAKHFSQQEIRSLIEFYETELGRKTIRVMPTLVQESAQAGQQWSAEIMPRLEKTLHDRLKAEGLDK